MIIERYLNQLNKEDAGGFAIDSFPTKAKSKPLIMSYEKSIVEEAYDLNTKRIMIDLDGTIHKYSEGWKDGTLYDEPFDGAKQIINQLKKDGFEIGIFTARLSKETNVDITKQKLMIEEWLTQNGIEIDFITSEKLPAEVYVDDRGLHFEGQWDKELYNEIKNRIGVK